MREPISPVIADGNRFDAAPVQGVMGYVPIRLFFPGVFHLRKSSKHPPSFG